MAFQILGSDKVLRLNDGTLLGMVQSFDWSPNMNAQDVYELGKTAKVATSLELETSGSMELNSVGGLAGFLARMIVDRDVDGTFLGYKYDPSGGSGKNGYTFTEADLVEATFDIVMHEKADQKNFNRSLVLPRCFLTTLSGRADANGNATETVNFQGDFVLGLTDPYHDVRAIPATFTTGSTCTLADTGVGSATHELVYLYVNERRIRTVADGGVSASLGAAGVITVTGLTLVDGDTFRAIVHLTTPSTTFPSLLDADRHTSSFFVRGYQQDIFLMPADENSPTKNERWLRAQSLDWTVDLRVEPLRQIAENPAGTAVYCRLPTLPFDVSVNLSVYEDQWADWAKILNPAVKDFAAPADVYEGSYDLNPLSLLDSFKVLLRSYTKTGTTLQTITFGDLRLDSMGARITVGGRSEIQWSLRGTAFKVVGANA